MIKKKTGKSKIKVDKLSVNKETVQDLGDDDMEKVKGGNFGGPTLGCVSGACQSQFCNTNAFVCQGGTVAGTPGCGGKTSGKKCNP